jgi:RNA polymerase sigma factor (sigma-70 family)
MEPSTVLFLAANPVRLQWLQLGAECRAIEDKIRAAKFRDRLRFRSRWAARPDDLLQALNEDTPTVLHFSGHGDGDHGLYFQAEDGSARSVSADGLAQVMQAAGSSVVVVLLNACFSKVQAQTLSAHIPCVIGMPGALGDGAAISYATSFYRALAYGRSVANAHEQGVAALALAGNSGTPRDVECRTSAQRAPVPSLLTRADTDANCIYVVQQLTNKTRCTVVIKATLREFNADVLARVTEELRQWTGDLSLQITNVDEGSVRLSVALSIEAAKRLAEAKNDGQLTHLGGFRVTAVIASDETGTPLRSSGPPSAAIAGMNRSHGNLAHANLEPDLALLDRWGTGDSYAGDLLFTRNWESLYRFFERKTKDDIEDLVQETFLQCVKRRSKFARGSSFRSYLFAIARVILQQHWRARALVPATRDFDDVSMAELSLSIDLQPDRSTDRARLLAALQRLPLDEQLLLELHYWQDLNRDQLAEVFNVPATTIGGRLFRARQALRDRLDSPDAGREPTFGTSEAFDAWARSLADDKPIEK